MLTSTAKIRVSFTHVQLQEQLKCLFLLSVAISQGDLYQIV